MVTKFLRNLFNPHAHESAPLSSRYAAALEKGMSISALKKDAVLLKNTSDGSFEVCFPSRHEKGAFESTRLSAPDLCEYAHTLATASVAQLRALDDFLGNPAQIIDNRADTNPQPWKVTYYPADIQAFLAHNKELQSALALVERETRYRIFDPAQPPAGKSLKADAHNTIDAVGAILDEHMKAPATELETGTSPRISAQKDLSQKTQLQQAAKRHLLN